MATVYCGRCCAYKDVSEFGKGVKKGGRQSWCMECNRLEMRSITYWRATKLSAWKAGQGCKDCDEDDPIVLVFHHRDPSKKSFGIGLKCTRKWSNIMIEIDKCDVLCCNCHARRHHKMREEGKGATNNDG